jgi:hypothetical protein
MNILNLRDHVNDYHQYVYSFLNIRGERSRDFVRGELSKEVLNENKKKGVTFVTP